MAMKVDVAMAVEQEEGKEDKEEEEEAATATKTKWPQKQRNEMKWAKADLGGVEPPKQCGSMPWHQQHNAASNGQQVLTT